jgi:sterol desaturase/sphingolipid hydroxylase (fatty acid hydroxylase superfamily)
MNPMLDEPHLGVLFLKALVGQTANYFIVVGLVFVLVWKVGARALASRRIPTRFDFGREQLVREVKNTLVTLTIGTVSAVVIMTLYKNGLTKLSAGDDWSALKSVGAFAALIFFNEAWFYWWHRLLHHPILFKYVHSVHHRSVDVNPFTSYSFHGVEGFILGAWAIPLALLVPMSVKVLIAAQVVGLANNVVSHLGYELLPKWWVRVPPFKWFSSATFHSLHHSTFNGNYGLMTRFWDRLMGTEVRSYEQVFVKRSEPDKHPGVLIAPKGHAADPSASTGR